MASGTGLLVIRSPISVLGPEPDRFVVVVLGRVAGVSCVTCWTSLTPGKAVRK